MTSLDRLLARYRKAESAERRGPCFAKPCYAIEESGVAGGIRKGKILEWFGPPDLFFQADSQLTLVYRFDHEQAGHNREEWYFHFQSESLVRSGFNSAGINPLIGFRPGSELPSGE